VDEDSRGDTAGDGDEDGAGAEDVTGVGRVEGAEDGAGDEDEAGVVEAGTPAPSHSVDRMGHSKLPVPGTWTSGQHTVLSC